MSASPPPERRQPPPPPPPPAAPPSGALRTPPPPPLPHSHAAEAANELRREVAPQPPPSSDSAEASEVERKRKRDTYYDKHEELEELAAKDELTLMVRQLHPRTAEFDVFELFSSVGKVKDVRLIQDERSGKCVGVGYVEMATRQDLAMALGLDGTVLRGMPMVVQVSFAEKNRLAATGASAAEIKAVGHGSNGSGGGGGSDAGMKLYVGSLHPSLTEDQLRGVFAPFGQLDRVDVHKTPTGESKGYAFLHFALAADGRKCMAQMDGFSLAGRPIRVSPSGQDLSSGTHSGGGGGGRGGRDASIEKLDSLDEGSGGSKVTAAQRAQMMARLAEKSGLSVPGEVRTAAAGAASYGVDLDTSRCLAFKNMFDRLSPEATSNPNFFAEIVEDVRSEVSKLGTVIHCAADKWSNGFVYCKLLAHQEAARVRAAMHGRYFAKNRIICEYVEESVYDKKNKLKPS